MPRTFIYFRRPSCSWTTTPLRQIRHWISETPRKLGSQVKQQLIEIQRLDIYVYILLACTRNKLFSSWTSLNFRNECKSFDHATASILISLKQQTIISQSDFLLAKREIVKMCPLATKLLLALAIFCLAQLRVTVFATDGKWKTSHRQINQQSSMRKIDILRLTLCLLAKTFEIIGNDVAKFVALVAV